METRDPLHERIFEHALPYLQTRHNEPHTRVSYAFAARLLAEEPGDAEVVLPAILLHDVGWSRVPEDQQLAAFGPNVKDPELTRVHEREGATLAAEILSGLGCQPRRIREIAEIIDGHDTRATPLGPSDAVVKDADKLFRFSRAGFAIDYRRFDLAPSPYLEWLERQIDRWFITRAGKRMARQEAAERRREIEAAPDSSRVTVRLKLTGFPDLARRLGSEETDVELGVPTLAGLVAWLQRLHGDAAGVRLVSAEGHVDDSVQIIRNGTEWVPQNQLDYRFRDGDQVTLVILVAGG